MDTLVFFFDRTFGVRLPKALHSMQPPPLIRWHQEQGFARNMADDEWLNVVGPRKWVVLSQDRHYHLRQAELLAVKQHSIRCFYLPCASDHRWVSMCHFVSRYSKMMDLARSEPAPFIYEMKTNRQFYKVSLGD